MVHQAFFTVLAVVFQVFTLAAQSDSISAIKVLADSLTEPVNTGGFFKLFSGGLNGLYNPQRSGSSLDLSVQTYHFLLITRRKFTSDSLHMLKVSEGLGRHELYRGVDFYILSRACLNLDSVRSMASEYITTTLASPLTLRISRTFMLSENHAINQTDLRPVLKCDLAGDLRATPFQNKLDGVHAGVSFHLLAKLTAQFKRYELNASGHETDQGLLYIEPAIHVAYGSPGLMESVLRVQRFPLVFSSECKLGLSSEKAPINDFCLFLRYIHSDIIGPKLRVGLIVSSKH